MIKIDMKKLTIEDLENVSGGVNSEDIPGALSRLFDAAKAKYEQWEAQNPNATEEESYIKARQCFKEAYQTMSAADKELIDVYAAQDPDFQAMIS